VGADMTPIVEQGSIAEATTLKKPEWIKRTFRMTPELKAVEDLVSDLRLNTVCREASCPNYSECFGRGTATFMILGAVCTRHCGFCGVTHADGAPLVLPGSDEPERVGEAVRRLNLSYVVITSVTRDDLPDGGAEQFARTVRAIRRLSPHTRVETLIPDFAGDPAALDTVLEAAPDVVSHNMETVRALYGLVRPQADYERSLLLIRRVADWAARPVALHRAALPAGAPERAMPSPGIGGLDVPPHPKAKSGLMVGVGETEAQVFELFADLRGAGCELLTIGQYLRPSPVNIPVRAYVTPEAFARYEAAAYEAGFEFVASAPFVRSSYHAEEALR